jgi:hypothetical protein
MDSGEQMDHMLNDQTDDSYFESAMETMRKRNSRSKPLQAFPAARDYRAVSLCFTVANVITEEALVGVFASHPKFLASVRPQVLRHMFKTHAMSYAKACGRVYKNSDILLRLNYDSGLVDWYERKLEVLESYNCQPDNLPHIVKLQKFIRGYVGKLRFRKVCKLAAEDPRFMHRRVMQVRPSPSPPPYLPWPL